MPKLIDQHEKEWAVSLYLKAEMPIIEICKVCNMSPTTLYRIMREENVQENIFTWMKRQ